MKITSSRAKKSTLSTSLLFLRKYWFNRLLPIGLFLFFLSNTLQGQSFLLLKGPKANQRAYHQNGNYISFLLRGQESLTSGFISDFNDSTLTIGKERIQLSKIKYVVKTRRGVSAFSKLFIGFGVVFAGLDILNAATNDLKPVVDPYVIQLAAFPVLVGLGLKPFIKKKLPLSAYSWEYIP